MKPYLLLILLFSWAHVVPLSLQCEAGVAYPNHVLSVPRSLMANADVAVLKSYQVATLDKCITDCCTEKFGSCTVASFEKNNDTELNCHHYNCRPVEKCKFLSSNSTDSFSFTSASSPHVLVPSSQASKNDSLSSTLATVSTNKSKLEKITQNKEEHGVTKEIVATYPEEQFALKNDNTTIKPRKGVDDVTENLLENVSRSGVKPRKGVSLDGLSNLNNTKSKVKPRKGVGPYQSSTVSPALIVKPSAHEVLSVSKIVPSTSTSYASTLTYNDTVADDIVSALEKVFEDDPKMKDTKSSIASPVETPQTRMQTSATVTNSFIPKFATSIHTSSSTEKITLSPLQPSLVTNYIVTSTLQTPTLITSTIQATENTSNSPMTSSGRPSIIEHSKLLFQEFTAKGIDESEQSDNSAESENQRKYESSMHLVLALVFGLLVLFSVLGVIAKRVYDGWMRRHYRRMDFLIDGMYNGYG